MYGYQRWHTVSVMPDDLIAFAWSAPMRDLAARIGLSDVGLKKLLKGYGVVTPPQGHWNRVHAGRTVAAPPKAPPRHPGETGRIRVDYRFAAFVPEAQPMPSCGPFASSEVPEELEALRAREVKAIGRAGVPRALDAPAPALKGLLEKEAKRRTKVAGYQWHWDTPRFDTPLWQRQLRLLNGIFLALRRRGHGGEVDEGEHELRPSALVGAMRVRFAIEVAGKHKTMMRSGRKVPALDLPATTPLRLSITDGAADALTAWQDDEAGKLESKVAAIAAELIVAGEAAFRRMLREDEEQAERERIEREAQAERDRIERERRRAERLKQADEQRVAALKLSGERLRLAADLRALVAQVREAAAQRADVSAATLAEWEVWALAEPDRIDPIRSGQFLDHLHPPGLHEDEV